MVVAQKSGFQFHGFQILKSHIEKQQIDNISTELDINFNPSGKIDRKAKKFNLYVETNVKNSDNSFSISVLIVGFFEYSTDSDEKVVESYFYVNAPAIIFPYIRAYVSALTALSGYAPLHLPTINFSSIGNILKKNTSEI